MNYGEVFHYFREKYEGKKLSFYLAGGAVSIVDFLKVPGAGRFIYSIHIPYDEKANKNFIEEITYPRLWSEPSVSYSTVRMYDDVLRELNNNSEVLRVVVSCALTTNRYRKGDNRAIISFNGELWKLMLNKLSEKEHLNLVEKAKNADKNNPEYYSIDTIRYREDEKVSQIVLAIIMGDSTLNPALDEGETLERVI